MSHTMNAEFLAETPINEYTVFAMTTAGEVVGQSGSRVNQDELIKLIDELLENEEVGYVEVHDGSCSVKL